MSVLAGKNIAVIGGLNTVALAVAKALGKAGASVTLAHHRTEEPPSGHGTLVLELDNPVALAEQVRALEPLDGVVLSPGWMQFGEFMDTTPADWDAALAHNFEYMTYAAQAAAKLMIAQANGGRIVFLTHVSALLPLGEMSAVGSSLTALWGLAKMAAVDLGPHGITVNLVASGWVDAEWSRPYLGPEERAFVEAGIPAGRVGTPGEIGAVCAFLLSDAAAYVTGTMIPVDGGYVLTPSEGESPLPH
jgi:2-deoxy-D-gluconate 3-dehydrogenase